MSVRPSPSRRGPHLVSAPRAVPTVTAASIARSDPHFNHKCKEMGVAPTKRQARAYLAKRGRWAAAREVARA